MHYIDMCHNRLIRMRQYRRKIKVFLLCILAKKFGNINFLKTPKEALLKISCNLSTGELVGINGLIRWI